MRENIIRRSNIKPKTIFIIVAVAMIWVSAQIYLEKTALPYEESKKQHFTVTWREYVKAFKDYVKVHPSSDGYVTEWLALPSWVDKEDGITAYIENGKGYLFYPASKELYYYVLKAADNPQMIGYSDKRSIKTKDVIYHRPDAVPADNLVFVMTERN